VRKVLTPRWVAWHVLAVVLAITFVRLGLWQWHRAHETGSAQNMGYALQWPAFAAFGVFLWWRTVRDAVRPRDDRPARPATARKARPVPAPARPVTDEEDPEMAAYNRYLAALNAADMNAADLNGGDSR
jgi:DNA-binding transcriptional regulator of glucitol operon